MFSSLQSRLKILAFITLLTGGMACSLLGGANTPSPVPEETTPPIVEVTGATGLPTAAPTEAVATPQRPTQAVATPTSDAKAACPIATEGMTLYLSENNGYCFLFPGYFTPTLSSEGNIETITLTGPREAPGPKKMERMWVSLSLSYNGPADGLDSNAYAEKWVRLFASFDPVQPQPYEVGGLPAVLIEDLPGYSPVTSAFVVANDIKYSLTLQPQVGDMAELDEHTRLVWDTVIQSIVFIPPVNERIFIRNDRVCPTESSNTRLFINEQDGYCLLYPSDFIADPDFRGNFKGGPILGDYQDFKDVQTSITVGTFGNFPGQTIREAMSARLEFSDTSSIQDATVGGYPAITYRHLAGPWASRDADVTVNGRVFTILAQPWEPVLWPQGTPFLDLVWDTVIHSIQFFDPWR